MRELKFRAWDSTKSEMFEVKSIKFWLFNKPARYEDGSGEPKSGFTLMQYTGLKDKNGKEIYEGDILEYSIQGITQKPYYVVKDMLDLRLQMNRDDNYYRRDECITVVGNIYENPDLLTN